MSVDINTGPGVNLNKICKDRGLANVEDVILSVAGHVFRDAEDFAEYDLENDGWAYESYLDALFYEYTDENLDVKLGKSVFSYWISPDFDCYIYADARDMFKNNVSWNEVSTVLKADFGEEIEIGWVEYISF